MESTNSITSEQQKENLSEDDFSDSDFKTISNSSSNFNLEEEEDNQNSESSENKKSEIIKNVKLEEY